MPPSAKSAAPRPSGGYLAAPDLERQLGNAFRKGLYRLAVMSQRTEDAMDLGQRLPTGLLRDVSCDVGRGRGRAAAARGRGRARSPGAASRGARSARRTRCSLRARRSASRRAPRRTASARYDSTIRTYSADPLDALGSVRRGC